MHITQIVIVGMSLICATMPIIGMEETTGTSILRKEVPKILIISLRAGGGHISTSDAIKSYLDGEYDVQTMYVFEDILESLDCIKKLTCGFTDINSVYNYLIKNKWYETINSAHKLMPSHFETHKVVSDSLTKVRDSQVELIISVVPFVNHVFLTIAEKLDIPFLLVPTDLDPTNALMGIEKPQYQKFKLCLAYDHEMIKSKIRTFGIANENISYIGFPVKKCFLDNRFCAVQPKTRDLPLVLLAMGSQGSIELPVFARNLAQVKTPLYLSIILGKAENLRGEMERIQFPSTIQSAILDFTEFFPELLKTSDLFITKPGGLSINEALYAQVPMLIDCTSKLLSWEKFNAEFITRNSFGKSIKKRHTIASQVDDSLRKEVITFFKGKLKSFKKPNAMVEIRKLVEQFIE